MKPGSVWILHCVGMTILTLILDNKENSIAYLNLETGVVHRWHSPPKYGWGVGNWSQLDDETF